MNTGDLVRLPVDFCPGCGSDKHDLVGVVTSPVASNDVHALLRREHGDGPYWKVHLHHEHGSSDGGLVYAEAELARVAGATRADDEDERIPTSWGTDADDRWNTFRQLVLAGVDPDEAAARAGLEPIR